MTSKLSLIQLRVQRIKYNQCSTHIYTNSYPVEHLDGYTSLMNTVPTDLTHEVTDGPTDVVLVSSLLSELTALD